MTRPRAAAYGVSTRDRGRNGRRLNCTHGGGARLELHFKAIRVRRSYRSSPQLSALVQHSLCTRYALFSFGLRGKVPRQITARIPTQPRETMTTSLPSPDISLSDTASQPDDQPISVPKTSAATQSSHDLGASGPGSSHQMANSERLAAEKMGRTGLDAKTKMSNLLKDKEQEWTAVLEKKGPLQLLDLPMDVLKDIVKEVPPQAL